MSAMLQLIPKDCHNYDVFCTQGRCPLVAVCKENCVFVWKALYDGTKELNENTEIEYLKYEIEDLKTEIQHLEIQLEMADNKIEELTNELNGES